MTQVSAFAIGARFVETVCDWSANEAGAQYDRDEGCEVQAYDCPADHAKATDVEETDVKKEHGDSDADGCPIPYYVDGDEGLLSLMML